MNMERRLAKNIKAARKDAQVSMRALAERIGVGHITIRNYETGNTAPPVPVFLRIARALNTTAGELLKGLE